MKSNFNKRNLNIIKKLKHTGQLSVKSNLIKNGILDSFDIVILVSELEKKFKIKIAGDKINLKNFSNIEQICKLVENVRKF